MASGRKPVNIFFDPSRFSDLPEDEQRIVHEYFKANNQLGKKHKDKRKEWKNGTAYPFQFEEKEYLITFGESSFRRKKRYRTVIPCSLAGVPEQRYRKKNAIYLVENNEDGSADVYTKQNDHFHLSAENYGTVRAEQKKHAETALDGTNVYLMETPTKGTAHNVSDIHHLYLYKGHGDRLYYYINVSGKTIRKSFAFKKALLPFSLFDQRAESPEACQLTALCEKVLAIVSKDGDAKPHLPPDPKTIDRKKISVLMSACGLNRYSDNTQDDVLGEGTSGVVKKSLGKLVHTEDKTEYVSYQTPHLRKGCRVFLLEPPENPEDIELSDVSDLFLYKDPKNGEIFYRKEGASKKTLLPLNGLDFSDEKFIPIENYPQTLKNRKLREDILAVTSSGGDTNPAEIMFSRHQKAVKYQRTDKHAGLVEEKHRLKDIKTEADVLGQTDKTSHAKTVTTAGANTYSLSDMYFGRTLAYLIDEDSLTARQRYDLTVKLLEALKEFHDTGFVHRDIKPANIMVDVDDQNNILRVKIIDVGFARRKNDLMSRSCTPRYAAPEVWVKPKDLLTSEQQDSYALGLVLKELWGDKGFDEQRDACSSPRETCSFQAAAWYLNLPMKSVYSGLIMRDRSLNRADKIWLYQIMNEMTLPRPRERLSVESALLRRGAVVNPEARVGEVDAILYFQNLKKPAKKLLYESALQHLETLKDTLPEGNKKNIVSACWHLIEEAKKEADTLPLTYEDIETLVAMSKVILEARKESSHSDERLLKKYHSELKSSLSSYGGFVKRAWNETFLPGMTREQRKNTSFWKYFFGFPKENTVGKWVAYFCTFGFLMPFKNLLKLPEFLLKGASETIHYGKYKIAQTFPTSGFGKGLRAVGLKALSYLYWVPELPRLLVRTVTSPIASAIEATRKEGIGFGICSLVVSAAIFAALAFVAAPVVLPLLGVVGAGALGLMGVSTSSVVGTWFGGALLAVPVLLNAVRDEVWDGSIKRFFRSLSPPALSPPSPSERVVRPPAESGSTMQIRSDLVAGRKPANETMILETSLTSASAGGAKHTEVKTMRYSGSAASFHKAVTPQGSEEKVAPSAGLLAGRPRSSSK